MSDFKSTGNGEAREDMRGEWYRENDPYSASIPLVPRIYWLGMAASAIWIIAYLFIYPSIPLIAAQTHWKGIGMPGGCQSWTAICEMRQGEAKLHEVRGGYLERVQSTDVGEVAKNVELREFVDHAGRVSYVDNCAGCHGKAGEGFPGKEEIAPVLNDIPWLHGGSVQEIQASIRSESVHPFGLGRRIDEPDDKVLALYVYKLGGEPDTGK